MIQPKDLYRKLAGLLADIHKDRNDANYLLSVLARLDTSLTRDLHITNGRLYVEDSELFFPVNAAHDYKPSYPANLGAMDKEAARLVVTNGIYIYNDPSLPFMQSSPFGNETRAAAFTVKDPRRRWLFVFDLETGWIWEEVEFCLKAVRAQVNFQLQINAMKSDVEQAAIIQLSLLPSSPPLVAGYETAGRSHPADVVGGDFFDFTVLDEEFFTVAVGDASGHGLPAALLVRDVVTGLRMGVEKEMRMAEAMQKLNRVIHRSTLSSNFVSLFFAEIESNGHLLFVNAGHPPPLLVRGSNVKRLESTGMILGAVSETQFHRSSASFDPGAVLVLYSDGVLERRKGSEEFGSSRLEELVIRNQEKSAGTILEVILEAVTAFGDPPKFEDDVTLVVIKKVGP